MNVVLLRWPAEEERRVRLEQEGVPRLLLVERQAAPPAVVDAFEDWIRMPADDVDLQARVAALDSRQRVGHGTEPTLDDDGVLRARGGWAALPPVEGRLTRAMLERYGAVVSRDALARAGWPDGSPGRNALDVHVLRLRRRVAPLGLAIRTVRSRGYLMEPDGLPSDTRQEMEPNGSRSGHRHVTGGS
jgi:DNA-binding response OmpR family regulator